MNRRATPAPPERIEVDETTCLRRLVPSDAGAIAQAVGASLEHLRPWMPWAGVQSADPEFQRDRLCTLRQLEARGEEWQYGLFAAPGTLLGSFGLMTRRGPGTIEIGYWLHVDAVGHGHATRAVDALSRVAQQLEGVRTVVIYCDEANVRSAAIARRVGYRLSRIERRPPEAPGESGRILVWELGPAPGAPPRPVDA
ncbi:MAG TPA: GNAT family N-acetyltransferase [Acidimicrobiia bacterium]|nr:GNAT family N-acetyltransferase [Acidimicrobiia bacterium]